MAAVAAAFAEAQLAERQGEVVGHDQQVGQRRVGSGQHLAHGDPGIVHVGERLDEGQVEAVVAAHDDARGVSLAPAPCPAGTVGQPVDDLPTDVVPGPGVLRSGIPQADDDLHAILRTAEQGPIPIWEGLMRWYRSRSARIGGQWPPARSSLHLERAHRRFLAGLGVIPAAQVERAVRRQQAELVGGAQWTSPVWPPRPSCGLLDRSFDRDHDVAEVRAAARRQREGGRGLDRMPAAPRAGGPARLRATETPREAAAGTTARRSGRLAEVRRIERRELRVVGQDQPDRRR